MPMEELLKKPLPEIPEEIRKKLDAPRITLTSYAEKQQCLVDGHLQQEAGFGQFPDGSWLVSMYCPMPGVTAEMIRWWFWWHCQDALRYQVWFPGSHFDIGFHKKDTGYFSQRALPPFQPNSQLPVERIGSRKMPLRIDFVTPEDFGFARQTMEDHGIPLIVCGHVSALGGLIPHTEMAHVFRQTEEGLFLISRFWLGKTMKPLLRKMIMDETMARGMAEHCCVEYRNRAEILPELYRQYGEGKAP